MELNVKNCCKKSGGKCLRKSARHFVVISRHVFRARIARRRNSGHLTNSKSLIRISASVEQVKDVAQDGTVLGVVKVSNEIGIDRRSINRIQPCGDYNFLAAISGSRISPILLLRCQQCQITCGSVQGDSSGKCPNGRDSFGKMSASTSGAVRTIWLNSGSPGLRVADICFRRWLTLDCPCCAQSGV